jgi:hypothetical protein
MIKQFKDVNLVTDVLEQRMYSIVLYNLSPIQKGIQAYHASIDYELMYGDDPEYQRWAQIDKTVIILDGGGSVQLQKHLEALSALNVKTCMFCEPDLYGGTTAVSFLVDERIWNREKYPDIDTGKVYDKYSKGTLAIASIFNLEAFKESIGGENNFQLMQYLSKLRLAQ